MKLLLRNVVQEMNPVLVSLSEEASCHRCLNRFKDNVLDWPGPKVFDLKQSSQAMHLSMSACKLVITR